MSEEPKKEVPIEVPKPAAEAPKAKPRPEYSHPALRAIGIRRLRLPSRNWTIFFTVTGLFFGGLYYDKNRRQQIRDSYKSEVEFLSENPIGGLQLPRKVQVYLAPPPGDTLDITRKNWRRNIKPYLTAAAIDFEIVDEDKQGHIRSVVAENIRNIRRASRGMPTTAYTPDELDHKINDKTSRDSTGGVICVGRGAYKEYMAGLQEGWMGPLEEPKFVTDEKNRIALEKQKAAEEKAAAEAAEKAAKDGSPQTGEAQAEEVQKVDIPEPSKEEKSEEEKKKEGKQVIPTWLPTDQYAEADVDPLFYQQNHEPIVAIKNPHILGFLRTPQRFARFMTRSKHTHEAGSQTKALILQQTRPFHPDDVNLQLDEEEDWPKKWKQKGADKNSEWMREFKVDDRIASHLIICDIEAHAQVTNPRASAPTLQTVKDN